MKQPKYSPEETLQRIKLMMEYDSSKTLDENKQTISEQTDDIDTISNEIKSFNTDEQKIVDILKTYKSQSNFLKFLRDYKSKTGNDLNVDMYDAFQGGKSDNGNWTGLDAKELNDLEAHLKTIGMQFTPQKDTSNRTTGYTFQSIKAQNTKTGGGQPSPQSRTSQYSACTEDMPIKYGCKNETIKKVQTCLGLVADGKFGPKTKQSLIDKGQNGDQIDSGTIIAVCKSDTPKEVTPKEVTPKEVTPKFEPDDSEESSATDLLN
jgi:hypothetical protein